MIPRIEFDPTAPAPLDGIRVVDLSRLVAGNMVSLQLADQGAEVIKIEDPKTGDPLRAWRVKGCRCTGKSTRATRRAWRSTCRPQAGARRAAGPAGDQSGADRELPAGHAGNDGLGPGRAACAQSGACHRAHHRLRAGRSVSGPARVRHAGRGDVRVRREEWIWRPAAGAAAAGAGRHGFGIIWRLRGDGGAARGRAWRTRPGDRPSAVGADDFGAGSRRGGVSGLRGRSRSGREADR